MAGMDGILPEPARAGSRRASSQSFIVSGMSRRNRQRVWAWLLCALLFWITANPPHCDLCDGISVTVAAGRRPTLKHSHPNAPESCNGICPCCGFCGLPNAGPTFAPEKVIQTGITVASPRPAITLHSAVFHPPRSVVS